MPHKNEMPKPQSSDRAAIERYLSEVASHRRLGEQEEQKLVLRMQQGDESASAEIVEGNLWHVVNIAKQYVGRGLRFDDIINEGNIGLVLAVNHFDNSHGKRFASYATRWIKQQIEAVIANQPQINRQVSDGATDKIETMNDTSMPASDTAAIADSMASEIAESMDLLNERERMVIERAYGINHYPMTFAEIGQEMGLKRERVRQIRKKALQRLRKANNNRQLKSFITEK